MSTQTIRDVLIKVAIENGNMKLGPVDTSAFTSAIENVRSDWQRLATEMKQSPFQSAFSSISDVTANATRQIRETEAAVNRMRATQPVGTSAAQAAARDFQDAIRIANQNMQESVRNDGQGPIKIGMPGYGQSVRDRAEDSAQTSLKSAQDSGSLNGATDKDLERLQSQLEKRAAMLIREQDRELANGERAAEQEKKRQDALVDKAEQGAMRIAKGIGSLIDGGSKASAEFNKMLESIQAAYNIGKDLSSAIQSVSGSNLKPLSPAESTPTAAQSNTQAATSAVSDLTTVTNGAAAANGLLSASALPLAAAIAAVVLTVKATISAFEQARDLNREYVKSMADDAIRSADLQSKSMIRLNEQRRALVMERPETHEQQLVGSAFRQSEKREAEIRQTQAAARKAGMSEDRIQEIRTRGEAEEGLSQRSVAANTKREVLTQKLKDIESAQKALDDPGSGKRLGNARERATTAIDESKDSQNRTVIGHMANMTLKSGAVGYLASMSPRVQNWIDESTGGISSRDAERSADDTKLRKHEFNITAKGDDSAIAEQRKQLAQDHLTTQKALQAADVETLKAKKESVQLAYKTAEVEQSRTRSAMLSFGSLDPGQQAQLRIINDKSKRIEEQQRRKDAGENVNVEQWTHFEMQMGFGKGRKNTDNSMRRQQEKAARDSGIFDDDISENDALQSKAVKLEEKLKPEQDLILSEVDKLSADMKQSAEQIVQAMKEVFGTKQALEVLKSQLDEMKSTNRLNESIRKSAW